MSDHDFQTFPKISRLCRMMVVTEKIDGTNAQVFVVAGSPPAESKAPRDVMGEIIAPIATVNGGEFDVYAGSRNRWITPADDNFGFAHWVADHADELAALGPGRHFGEWWGSGIQRGYGLPKGEKRFSLFNVGRWSETPPPACCSLVPKLYEGDFSMEAVEGTLDTLKKFGSLAAPGYAKPEGVVVYHVASRTLFKRTIEKDDEPKGAKS